MHILLVSNYFEPDSGAAAVRLTRLVKILHDRGHQITVLTSLPHYPQGRVHSGYRGRFVVKEDRDGVRVIQTWLLATSSPRISLKLISQISFMLSASLRGLGMPCPDVILIEAQPIFTSLAAVFLAMIKRCPYVLNVSDLWPDHLLTVGVLQENSLIYRTARRLVDFTYRHASCIVAMSPEWAAIIQDHIGDSPSKDVRVVLNGVDLQKFRPGLDTTDFRRKYQLSNEQRLITFIGTFSTPYDFRTQLDVARHFNDRTDVKFVYIGRGSQSTYFKEQVMNSDLSNLRWIDWIEHAEIAYAWNASHITYWALRDQNLYRGTIPAKLYEALACGTPIAAATEGISGDIVSNNRVGIAVPCGETSRLITAIEHLLGDESFREECSQNARWYAENNFNPDVVAKEYETVLKTAAQKL